jgi:hypothetical protein
MKSRRIEEVKEDWREEERRGEGKKGKEGVRVVAGDGGATARHGAGGDGDSGGDSGGARGELRG